MSDNNLDLGVGKDYEEERARYTILQRIEKAYPDNRSRSNARKISEKPKPV